MGSSVNMASVPRFRARAIGSFKQLPGCPDYVVNALEKQHLEKMSQGLTPPPVRMTRGVHESTPILRLMTLRERPERSG